MKFLNWLKIYSLLSINSILMNKFDPTVDKQFHGDFKDSKYSFEFKKLIKSLTYLVLAQLWKYTGNANPLNNHGTLESKSGGLTGTWIWAGKHWEKKGFIKRGLPDVIVTVTSKNENSQAITLDDGVGGEFVNEQQCKKATRI